MANREVAGYVLLARVEHEDGAIVMIMSCNYDCATSVSIE